MGWHLIQNKENYMKKKDLILAGAVLLLAGILALALRLPKTENGNTMKVTVDGEVYSGTLKVTVGSSDGCGSCNASAGMALFGLLALGVLGLKKL